MKNIFWQQCNSCEEKFRVKYFSNGDYEYVDEPCSCEDGFSPIYNSPSFSEWLEKE